MENQLINKPLREPKRISLIFKNVFVELVYYSQSSRELLLQTSQFPLWTLTLCLQER